MNYSEYRKKCLELVTEYEKKDVTLQSRILKKEITEEIAEYNRKLALIGPKYALFGIVDYGLINSMVDTVTNFNYYPKEVALASIVGVTLYNMALIPTISKDYELIKSYRYDKKALKENKK